MYKYTLAMVLRPLIERKLPINAAFSESLILVELFYDNTPVETGSYSVVFHSMSYIQINLF